MNRSSKKKRVEIKSRKEKESQKIERALKRNDRGKEVT
jgi:hypothetical protein